MARNEIERRNRQLCIQTLPISKGLPPTVRSSQDQMIESGLLAKEREQIKIRYAESAHFCEFVRNSATRFDPQAAKTRTTHPRQFNDLDDIAQHQNLPRRGATRFQNRPIKSPAAPNAIKTVFTSATRVDAQTHVYTPPRPLS